MRYTGTIVLLWCFAGIGVEAFSFSSASVGIDAILALRLDGLVLDSTLELDVRRNALEIDGRVFAALPKAEGTLGGTGDEVRVPTAEVRRTFEGCTAGKPAVDGATFVRPGVGPIVPRAPCLRFT